MVLVKSEYLLVGIAILSKKASNIAGYLSKKKSLYNA